jgi:hypothetical protein
MRLLDPRFRYIPAARTDVSATWRRFGFRPTTESERRARQRTGADDAGGVERADISVAPPFASTSRLKRASLKLAR